MANDIKSTGNAAVDEFLRKKLAGGVQAKPSTGQHGRLIFALDATASRQETWDTACHLQAGMFREARSIGGLDVQLAYYRGDSECKASGWLSDTGRLTRLMGRIECRAGHTQIKKVLTHVKRENLNTKVHVAVFVGDALEERPGELYDEAAGLGVPMFLFQEGNDSEVQVAFKKLAKITGGAYGTFDAGSAKQLGELLRAVAVFATGGLEALSHRQDTASVKLLGQLR